MPSQTKTFSLQEANAALPELEKILARLLSKKESHEKLHDHHFMEELLHEATQNKFNQELDSRANHVDGQVFDLEEDLKAIRTLGCILRSLERGWVEFPAELKGEKIYFCWKKGETTIQYFRSVESPSLERFPL